MDFETENATAIAANSATNSIAGDAADSGENFSDGYTLIPEAVLLAGERVPVHFGNPFREEEALISGRAFADLSFFEVLSVSGPDRTKWLHSLTTCSFESLGTGISAEMLVLSPSGQIEHAAAVIDDGERTWMILDQGKADGLAQFLCQMKFMMRVEIARHNFTIIGFGAVLDDVPKELRDSAIFSWQDPWPEVAAGGAHYGIMPGTHPGAEVKRTLLAFSNQNLLAPQLKSAIADGWKPAGYLAWEAARIRCWRPRPASEMIQGVLPHELDLLRTAVHLAKGCYRGQETVAKIVNLGRPPRRLTYLYIEAMSDTLPEAGAEIFHGKRKVGVLTSVARDYEDGPVGLALIKRAVDLDAVLTIGGVLIPQTESAAVQPDTAGSENAAAAAIFIASQREIVSREGKSSVSPAERPGSELPRHRGS